MVDFHDPSVIADEFLALTKLFHVVGGLYIWEFFTTIDYEWSVIRGRRPYWWTIWIYSFTRMATLMSVILTLVALNPTRPIDCQALVTSTFVFGYMALSASLLLLMLRTIAIWNKKKVVVMFATCIWCIYLAFVIEGVTQLRSAWLSGEGCIPPDMERDKLVIIIMLAADILLVLTMFLGLLRLRDRAGGLFGLARLLWKQGVLWLLVAFAAGLTTVVVVCLDLNLPLNIMFLTPTLVTMSITATWMYTSLTDSNSSTDIVTGSLLQMGQTHHIIVPSSKRIPKVHVTYEQHTIVTTNEWAAVRQTAGTGP